MRAVDLIQKKRDGSILSPEEIAFFIEGVTSGALPDYQASALLMAVYFKGMTPQETAALTQAMVDSGVRVDLSDVAGAKVDKHSTGGVGDKSSLILAPIVAACGALVPMMSGRGLGHTGGTLDKLESIPGFRTNLTVEEMKRSLASAGCAMMGQTAAIAPADKRLYALRDVSATVESIPLISASIMSKKIAEGIEALVLDVKAGRGAFMKSASDAKRLASSLVSIGNASGLRTQAVVTAMDAPIGRAVGNALEVIECLDALKGTARSDLMENSLDLSERMLVVSGVCSNRAAAADACRKAVSSGQALERFRRIVELQGGNPAVVDDYRLLPAAPSEHVVTAGREGFVESLDAELIGRGAVVLGAGRDTMDAEIDPSVGVLIETPVGTVVKRGDAILRVLYRDESRLARALPLLTSALVVSDRPPAARKLVLDEIL